VRAREEWGLPPLSAERHAAQPRAFRHAFPYATVSLAACVAGVAFALVVGPPRPVTPPTQVATASAPAGATSEPGTDHTTYAPPHIAAQTPANTAVRASTPNDATPAAVERPRPSVIAQGHVRRVSARARDRRTVVAATPMTEPGVVAAAVTASARDMEPMVLFVASAPAVVEIQAP